MCVGKDRGGVRLVCAGTEVQLGWTMLMMFRTMQSFSKGSRLPWLQTGSKKSKISYKWIFAPGQGSSLQLCAVQAPKKMRGADCRPSPSAFARERQTALHWTLNSWIPQKYPQLHLQAHWPLTTITFLAGVRLRSRH